MAQGRRSATRLEIQALTRAYRAYTGKKGYCAIGSVKSNVGHLDTAAGITGLIKTVLALKHRRLPPSLHFERPNPEIDFDNSPFYVNSRLPEWKSGRFEIESGRERVWRGGTNAQCHPGGSSGEGAGRPLRENTN